MTEHQTGNIRSISQICVHTIRTEESLNLIPPLPVRFVGTEHTTIIGRLINQNLCIHVPVYKLFAYQTNRASPSQYREKYKPMYDEQHAVITPEIRSILPMKVFCIEVGEKYKDELRYKLIWDRLTNYARQRNEEKSNDKFVSLSMDDPAITPIDKCRFYLGVIIDNKENDFQPGVIEVPGGRYAIFRHIGDYSLLHKFYRTIYEEWFPESKYRPQSTFSFEMYMNRPTSTLRTELMTDIYVPVTKK